MLSSGETQIRDRLDKLTLRHLPQKFKNSPTLFDESLPRDLVLFGSEKTQISLLQYVDDLLLAATTEQEARLGTEKLLAELSELGYKASSKKAQNCQTEVTYLGYTLRGGKRWLPKSRKKTVTQIPIPTTSKQVREFLGMAGFCRLWIPSFATLAATLYPFTKEAGTFSWTPIHQ